MFGRWVGVREWRPRTFLVIGLLGLVVYAFPGYMSNDSFQQLMEGRSGVRTDIHPPMMAFEWGLLDHVITGPVLMLLLQGALAVFGLNRIFRQVMSPRAAAIAAILTLWFPPVLTTFAVIWKDSQMAAFYLAGIGLLLDPSRRMRLLGLAAILLGCAFRHNAPAAALPAVAILFVWRDAQPRLQRYAVAVAAGTVCVVIAMYANQALTVQHFPMSPAVIDIVGIIAKGPPMADAELRPILDGTPLRSREKIQEQAKKVYTPRNPYWYDHGDDAMFDLATTDEQRAALQRAWFSLIHSYPGVYVRQRLRRFRELIGDTPAGLWAPVWAEYDESEEQPLLMQHAATRSPLQAHLMSWFLSLADHTPLFEPLLYLWLAFALLALCCRDRLSLALLTSGLCYELAYFPFVATPDYRYSHWMITCTVASVVILVARRWRAR